MGTDFRRIKGGSHALPRCQSAPLGPHRRCRLGDRQEKSSARCADPIAPPRLHSRLYLAVAGECRHRGDSRAIAIDLLVHIADAADVPGAARPAPERRGFVAALGLSCLLTAILFAAMAWALGRFGITL